MKRLLWLSLVGLADCRHTPDPAPAESEVAAPSDEAAYLVAHSVPPVWMARMLDAKEDELAACGVSGGTVSLAFTVSELGVVRKVTVVKTEVSVQESDCVREVLRGWRFPPTNNGEGLNGALALELPVKK